MQVNAKTLQENINGLKESQHIGGALSLKQEYQLEAYRMLLAYLLHDRAVDRLYGIEDKLNG